MGRRGQKRICQCGNYHDTIFTSIYSTNITHTKLYLQVFDSVESYAPGFKESIVGYEVLPPPELERIFGLTGGVSLCLALTNSHSLEN